MHEKLPVIKRNLATFKCELVLFGPYMKRLLCEFEKKMKSLVNGLLIYGVVY